MMLTKEDLQAISELINGAVSASENRIMAYIESDVKKEIRQIAEGDAACFAILKLNKKGRALQIRRWRVFWMFLVSHTNQRKKMESSTARKL